MGLMGGEREVGDWDDFLETLEQGCDNSDCFCRMMSRLVHLRIRENVSKGSVRRVSL